MRHVGLMLTCYSDCTRIECLDNATDAITWYAQLENKNKEKQLQIDQLFHENRMLTHQQRLLAKQIEELQDSKVR